ncbi:MAG: hypothetical protein KDD82_28700 [Planctomycetes bacterium]|nr:hypothetical protein [Planctomycetota bacterium]
MDPDRAEQRTRRRKAIAEVLERADAMPAPKRRAWVADALEKLEGFLAESKQHSVTEFRSQAKGA